MRKFILLLTAILTVNMSFFTVYAEETENLSRENYNFLASLGLLDNTNVSFEDLSENITRAEFVSMAIKLAVSENLSVTNAFYGDVPMEHSAAKAIYTAAALGIVSQADNFYPENIITLEQADKIAVRVLGYGDFAEVSGGWSAGYVNKAAELDINDGVLSGGELTKYDALCIIRNIAEADKARMVSTGVNITYEVVEGITPLTEIYDIYSVEGIIGEDGVIRYDNPKTGASKDKITIDNTIYLTGESDAEYFIGQSVKAYYFDDDGEYTILYVEADDKDNEVITIMSENMISYSGNVFTYSDEKGRSKTIKTTPSLKVIYNGERLLAYTDEHILPENGEITFVDNDKDNIFELAQVYSYENYYVEAKNASSYTITDGKSNPVLQRRLVLAPDKKTVRIYDPEGALVDFAAIPEASILTVFESADGSYAEVYICTASAEVTIKGIAYEGSKRVLTTAENELVLDNSYKGEINIGQKCVVYLNAYGNVAYLDFASSDMQVGYLLRYTKSEDDDIRRIKLLTADDEYKTFMIDEKARINDKRLLDENVSELWNGAKKPILYKLNDNGVVTDIYTASEKADNLTEEMRLVYYDEDTDGDGKYDSYTYYDPRGTIFISKKKTDDNIYFPAQGSAICFGVPMYPEDSTSDEDYYIETLSEWATPGLPYGKVKLYSFKNSIRISVAERLYETKTTTQTIDWFAANYGVIEDSKRILHEDGMAVQAVSTTSGNTIFIDEEKEQGEIHTGDIILYQINPSTKYFKYFKKLYCADVDEAYAVSADSHARKALKGEVTRIEGGAICLKLSDGKEMYINSSNTVYSMLDSKKPVTVASSEIAVGSEIIAVLSEGLTAFIMITG